MTRVVIVGAGVIGASCAYHMAKAGLHVTVLDRAPAAGAGSTARATGGFRAQYATAINIRLSLLARERLRAFRADTGVDPDFSPVGYLWLASSERSFGELVTANKLQREERLDARIVGVDEIRALNPHIELAGVCGGAFCPNDGTLRPMELLRGYLAAAVQHGAGVRWGEDIVALERIGDRITTVATTRGSYPADIVVNAAGAWAASLARLAGIEIPIVPSRRQVAITEPTTVLPATTPLTIWADDGFHFRVRDDRVLLLAPGAVPSDPFGIAVDPDWLDAIAALAPARIPTLRGVALDRPRAWAGLYELTPDRHALLGFVLDNLLLVNGSSGHGVMHAPALGLLAAELAAHGRTRSLDIHALRPSRFDDGESVLGSWLL